MNRTEYDFWTNKIKQDATEASEEMSVAFPELSKEKYFDSWIETHIKALDYLITHNNEISSYSIAGVSSDIINGRIKNNR